MKTSFSELGIALLPESILCVGALLALTLGILRRKNPQGISSRAAAVAGVTASVGALVSVLLLGAVGPLYNDHFVFDTLAVLCRTAIPVFIALAVIFSLGKVDEDQEEQIAVTLFAGIGLMIMSAAQHLLLMFAALELASLSLYLIAGFDRRHASSTEAALKYFLVGGASAAIFLFGISLIWGTAQSLMLHDVASALATATTPPLLHVALAMVIVAVGFKTAAAPFHLWAPDVYEGAPLPAVTLIASASKIGSLAFFFRLLWPGLGNVSGFLTQSTQGGWLPLIALLAVASLLIGNIGALAQTTLRRLLAYSAIAHAGVMLLALMNSGPFGPSSLFYYAATYGLGTVGALGVIGAVEKQGRAASLKDLNGLHKRSPFLALCLGVCILSLAGIPPLAGFFGKFSIFANALHLGGPTRTLGAVAFLGIAMSAVGLFYYLRILKAAWVTGETETSEPLVIPAPVIAALGLVTAGLVVLGLFPSLLLGRV